MAYIADLTSFAVGGFMSTGRYSSVLSSPTLALRSTITISRPTSRRGGVRVSSCLLLVVHIICHFLLLLFPLAHSMQLSSALQTLSLI